MPDFKKMALEISDTVTTWRHYFHQHPELSYKEVETTKKIVEILKEIGYTDIKVGSKTYPETGVIVDLNPGKAGPCLLLRADIDALPMAEQNDISYKSKNEGVMHACGHDAHISMQLGVAKLLYSIKDQINGNVRFLFQPGEEAGSPEEKSRAGARIMVEETDLLDGVDAVFGTHVWGTIPTCVYGYRPGPLMATNAQVFVTINGKGGHGGMPHTTIDPVPVACQIINAWQTIISRTTDPLETAVLTVGRVEAEGAWNIIPPTVKLTGGLRALNDDVIQDMLKRMEQMAKGISESMNCTAEFKYIQASFAVVNDKDLNDKIVASIKNVLGEDAAMEIPPVMPSEDFSIFQKHVPGVLIFLGVGSEEKQTNYAQHHPKYNVDDDALAVGVAGASAVAFDFINNK